MQMFFVSKKSNLTIIVWHISPVAPHNCNQCNVLHELNCALEISFSYHLCCMLEIKRLHFWSHANFVLLLWNCTLHNYNFNALWCVFNLDKVKVCFGNMFIKFPQENTRSMILKGKFVLLTIYVCLNNVFVLVSVFTCSVSLSNRPGAAWQRNKWPP